MSAELTSEAVMAWLKRKKAESGLAHIEIIASTETEFLVCDRTPGRARQLPAAHAVDLDDALDAFRANIGTPEQAAAKLRAEAARLLAEAEKLNPAAA